MSLLQLLSAQTTFPPVLSQMYQSASCNDAETDVIGSFYDNDQCSGDPFIAYPYLGNLTAYCSISGCVDAVPGSVDISCTFPDNFPADAIEGMPSTVTINDCAMAEFDVNNMTTTDFTTTEDDDLDDVQCPTGVLTYVDGPVAIPYIPLGICLSVSDGLYSYVAECNNDGESEQYVFPNGDCSGSPMFSDPDWLGNDTADFIVECDIDVPCNYAVFSNVGTNDREQDECDESESYEQAVIVGICATNGTNSFMVTCDEFSATRNTFAGDSCEGTPVEMADVIADFGDENCDAGSMVACYMDDDEFDFSTTEMDLATTTEEESSEEEPITTQPNTSAAQSWGLSAALMAVGCKMMW